MNKSFELYWIKTQLCFNGIPDSLCITNQNDVAKWKAIDNLTDGYLFKTFCFYFNHHFSIDDGQ